MSTRDDTNEDLAQLRVAIQVEFPRAALATMSDAVPPAAFHALPRAEPLQPPPDAIEALEAAWPAQDDEAPRIEALVETETLVRAGKRLTRRNGRLVFSRETTFAPDLAGETP